jgi:hypothetical protein
MKRLVMAFAIASIVACNSEKKTGQTVDTTSEKSVSASDTIAYTYDSVKVYSKNPVSKDAGVTDTAKAVITYPVFSEPRLNDLVLKKVIGTVNGEKTYATYKGYAEGFMADFDNFQKENKDRIQTWFLDVNTSVLKQRPKYLSFYTVYVNYSGGAHPNSAFTYQNYNPVTLQKITLDSLILPGAMGKLTAIAEKVFRTQEKLSANQSLKDGYFFENDTFKLNDNFTVTDQGLLFLYNPYEIKAYAFGITKLLIPFADLKDVAKPGSLLSVTP